MSSILSRANELSNFSNSFSKSKFILINSIKLEGGLNPSLGSFGQFLFTKINFLKFFDC